MNKQQIIQNAINFTRSSEDNIINKKISLSDDVIGINIFDDPIFAFGNPNDDYFLLLKNPSIIGDHFMLPKEWLLQAKTVISFFLPFSESIRKSNIKKNIWPSAGWLHGRIEGQAFLNELCRYLAKELIEVDYKCIIPSLDERFQSRSGYNNKNEVIDSNKQNLSHFTSNWSERHVAFICGLGTFGLSKGLITKKGVAGRFGSIITDLYLKTDFREYESISEYCSLCGECISQCPVHAISLEKGKNHLICSKFLNKIKERYKPRHGCGKCQVNIPCENKIPRDK